MTNRGAKVAAVLAAGLLLAGCGGTSRAVFTSAPTPAATASSTPWPDATWNQRGSVSWKWTPTEAVDCKSYQDGCFGITVTTQQGCPSGVYIELAVVDSTGTTVIDKANEITAGLAPGGKAAAVLSPPGGTPTGAKARVSQLNCMGD